MYGGGGGKAEYGLLTEWIRARVDGLAPSRRPAAAHTIFLSSFMAICSFMRNFSVQCNTTITRASRLLSSVRSDAIGPLPTSSHPKRQRTGENRLNLKQYFCSLLSLGRCSVCAPIHGRPVAQSHSSHTRRKASDYRPSQFTCKFRNSFRRFASRSPPVPALG